MIKMKVNIKNDITPLMKKKAKQLDQLPQKAYNFFVAQTPIKTGNARRNTDFNKQRDTITADYQYAAKLDSGSSRQAPLGMTIPTETFILKQVDIIIKGK